MLAVAVVLATASDVLGQAGLTQVAPQGGTGRVRAPAKGAALTSDREIVDFTDARRLLAESRFSEAIRNLDGILEAAQDSFLQPDKKSSVPRSLKAESAAHAGRPAAGRAQCTSCNTAHRASQMLDEALAADDAERLGTLSRWLFHTRGGSQATYLLGLYHLSHGQPLAAALALQRREAGQLAEEFEPALSLSLAACWLRAGVTTRPDSC